MNALLVYGLPMGALMIGAVAFLLAIRESRSFDRIYGAEKPEPKAAGDLFGTPPRRV